MIKVLFICHGNICRSTMCEFVFKDMVNKRGLADSFYIASAATSREEIGNDTHYGTKRKLDEMGIPYTKRGAVQMTKSDYSKYDYILGMDRHNMLNISRIIGSDPEGKVNRLLDFGSRPRDIADPWYTGNFDITYNDVVEGCEALLQHILENEKL